VVYRRGKVYCQGGGRRRGGKRWGDFSKEGERFTLLVLQTRGGESCLRERVEEGEEAEAAPGGNGLQGGGGVVLSRRTFYRVETGKLFGGKNKLMLREARSGFFC